MPISYALLMDTFETAQKKLADMGEKAKHVTEQVASKAIIPAGFKDSEKRAESFTEQLKAVSSGAQKVGSAILKVDNAAVKLLGKGAIQGAKLMGKAASEATEFLLKSVKDTTDYRKSLALLEQNASKSGVSMNLLKSSLSDMSVLTGGTSDSVKALSHLMSAGFDDNGVSTAVSALSGAVIQFPDIKMESLAKGLQETMATGTATGDFASLLKSTGGDVKAFEQQMGAATTSAEKQQVMLQWLSSSGLPQVSDGYKNANQGILTMAGAQNKFTEAQANIASAFEPTIASVKNGMADMALAMTGFLSGDANAAQNLQTSVSGFVGTMKETISGQLPQLTDILSTVPVELVRNLSSAIPELLPEIAQGGTQLLSGITEGITTAMPEITAALPEIFSTLGPAIGEAFSSFVDNGYQIVAALLQGINQALPLLLSMVMGILPDAVDALTNPENLAGMLTAGLLVFETLGQGLLDAIPVLLDVVWRITKNLFETFLRTDWGALGMDILDGIAKGLLAGVQFIGETISNVASSITNGFKSFFGIQSPSKLFRDQVGVYLAQGIGEGFSSEMRSVARDMTAAVPAQFDVSANAIPLDQRAGATGKTIHLTQTFQGIRSLNRYDMLRQTRNSLQFAALGV